MTESCSSTTGRFDGGGGERCSVIFNNNIANLGDDNLIAVATFLPKTYGAFPAMVALKAPAASWRVRGRKGESSPTSRAVVLSVRRGASFKPLLEGLWSKFGLVARRHNSQMRRHCFQLQEYYKGTREVLDFVDVKSGLAAKLTDEDLGAILVCIDANINLKQLNLTHCSTIVGHGLWPLCSPSILKTLDFYLDDIYSFLKNSKPLANVC